MINHLSLKSTNYHIEKKRYYNGDLALYLIDKNGSPYAELSLNIPEVELAPNEFILKNYSENKDLFIFLYAQNKINFQWRFIFYKSHIFPVINLCD